MNLIKNIIGFCFVILGIGWALFNRVLCNQLCNSCKYGQLVPCYFLFIFVGIILVISGVSLILVSGIKKED